MLDTITSSNRRGQWSGLGAKKGCRALGRVLAVLY